MYTCIGEPRDDREATLEAVKRDGRALQHASEELKGDRGVVMEAVKQCGYALEYASEELKGDREVVLEAIKQNGHVLRYASEELRSDGEVVTEAVKQIRIVVRTAAGSPCEIVPGCPWTCHDLKQEVQRRHSERDRWGYNYNTITLYQSYYSILCHII